MGVTIREGKERNANGETEAGEIHTREAAESTKGRGLEANQAY
jgi:hypothetical protein